MECNILRLADEKPEKKQCFKTKYKNIVIVKLWEGNYSITHYQTGVAIGLKNYTSVNEALLDLDNIINDKKEGLKYNNIAFEQFCKQRLIKTLVYNKIIYKRKNGTYEEYKYYGLLE